MRSPIIRRQDTTTTPVEGATQTSDPTSQSQVPEETTTPNTSESPSQTTSATTENSTPTSIAVTQTSNEPTSSQQLSTSTPITQSSGSETLESQTSTSSPGRSTSPTSQSATSSAPVTSTQSETINSLSLVTSSTPPAVSSTPTSVSFSIASSASISSTFSSPVSDTQTSSPTSISSSSIGPNTTPTSATIITTSVIDNNTSPSPTPSPTSSPASSTTPVREPSVTSDSASSTLTSILITTVTTVDGQPTTLTTVVPTLASSPQGSSGLSARSSKIVGGVVGGTLALLGVLLALFYISRRRRKVAAVRDAPRLQAPRQILDADDFDLAEPGPAPYAYGMVGAHVNPNPSGSIFHEALPRTSSQPSHSYSRSAVSENDPLMAHHMRGGSADIDSVTTSSPRESAHFRASSTTGLLYDPNDPFGDHPPRSIGSSSSRSHPPTVTKALEARSRGSDQHIYPPSAYRGPISPPELPSRSVLVHEDAGQVDLSDVSAPPAYGNEPR